MNDLVNGSFELFGGVAGFFNVKRLYNDKRVAGVSWPVTVFFTLWGFWNLWYYPNLHQYFSLFGAGGLVLTNTAWLILLWKYRKRP